MATPEEIFNQQIWEVLRDIQEEILVTVEGNPVKYRIPNVVGAGIIPSDRRIKIVYKLEEMGVFRVLKNESGQRIGRSDLYYLVIDKEGFRRVYGEYQRKHLPPSAANADIDEWLSEKDKWTKQKIWQVVSAINSEWQLRDEEVFRIPMDKFERARVSNQNDLEAILMSLHKRKIIEISRKLGETPPTNDPEKPQGSVWATVADDPRIIGHYDTQIKVYRERFRYLVEKLKGWAGNVKELSGPTSVQSAEWRDEFTWVEERFCFGEYGEVAFSSSDRKKLFKLLTDAKGNWVTVQNMEKEIGKDETSYIRPTLGQIEKQFDPKLKKYVSIPSTKNDNLEPKPKQGAYRIRFNALPQ